MARLVSACIFILAGALATSASSTARAVDPAVCELNASIIRTEYPSSTAAHEWTERKRFKAERWHEAYIIEQQIIALRLAFDRYPGVREAKRGLLRKLRDRNSTEYETTKRVLWSILEEAGGWRMMRCHAGETPDGHDVAEGTNYEWGSGRVGGSEKYSPRFETCMETTEPENDFRSPKEYGIVRMSYPNQYSDVQVYFTAFDDRFGTGSLVQLEMSLTQALDYDPPSAAEIAEVLAGNYGMSEDDYVESRLPSDCLELRAAKATQDSEDQSPKTQTNTASTADTGSKRKSGASKAL